MMVLRILPARAVFRADEQHVSAFKRVLRDFDGIAQKEDCVPAGRPANARLPMLPGSSIMTWFSASYRFSASSVEGVTHFTVTNPPDGSDISVTS